MTPAISFVIPVYNAAATLAATLDSIPPSTTQAYEIIISDDGSTDGSIAVAEAHRLAPQCRILRNANGGPSAARNAGMATATGDYVLCLDADDTLTPQAVDRLLAALQHNPRTVLAYGNYEQMDENGRVFGTRAALNKRTRPEGNCLRTMLAANFIISPGAVLMRREVVQRVGGFNTTLRFSEDWNLWCRMAMQGEFACVQGDAVLHYRRHTASATASAVDLSEKGLLALEAVFDNAVLRQHLSEKEIARLYAARRAHILMLQAVREARAGRWQNGLKYHIQSVKACPRRFVQLFLRFVLQGLKVV